MYYAISVASHYDYPCRMLDGESVRNSPADDVWWNDGAPLSGVHAPIRLALEPYDSRSPEQSDAMPSLFTASIPLVRADLLALLEREGVALEHYEVVIHDPDSGRELRNYRAVNLLGVISRGALGEFAGSLIDDGESMEVGYHSTNASLAPIDGHKLAWIEDTFTLVVHQTLRDRLLDSGIRDLVFSPLTEIAI